MLMTVIQWEKTVTIQKTETLLDASKEVGLKVNSEETKYMLVSHKKAGKKCIIRSWQRIFPLTSRPDQLWGPHSLLSHGYQGGLFPGVKRSWSVTLITHLSRAEIKNEWELHLRPPPPHKRLFGM
jgi:hypothetical protein